jgi:hypothetical protein
MQTLTRTQFFVKIFYRYRGHLLNWTTAIQAASKADAFKAAQSEFIRTHMPDTEITKTALY